MDSKDSKKPTKEEIYEVLKTVIDPEIGYDVVSLGEIDDVIIENDRILIKFIPTTPLCPYLPYMFDEIQTKIKEKFGLDVEFEISDKPWSIDRVNPEVRKKLGL
ncbi:NEQ350 [Nanoarchaeum equitans Kin4-M]|uniref:NEQ350 n=1 Tax=Nanoarchaeum equitans (strain Kin4-M) TaxID=228908 RepID=Q74NJ7_NANEQ|nr:NEQ350 [Nanoarchaeum equitans Kin4-M]